MPMGNVAQADEVLVGLAADTAEEDVNWSSRSLQIHKWT